MTAYEKAKSMSLPPLPWTHKALGEETYCRLAMELGYFVAAAERRDYRPDLDPTPFLELVKSKEKK
jgi:hypothetical protein